jgi:hypothetical protein
MTESRSFNQLDAGVQARIRSGCCRRHDIVIDTDVLQVWDVAIPRLRHRVDRAIERVVAVMSGPGIGVQICTDRNDAFDTLDFGFQQHGKNTSAAVADQNDVGVRRRS